MALLRCTHRQWSRMEGLRGLLIAYTYIYIQINTHARHQRHEACQQNSKHEQAAILKVALMRYSCHQATDETLRNPTASALQRTSRFEGPVCVFHSPQTSRTRTAPVNPSLRSASRTTTSEGPPGPGIGGGGPGGGGDLLLSTHSPFCWIVYSWPGVGFGLATVWVLVYHPPFGLSSNFCDGDPATQGLTLTCEPDVSKQLPSIVLVMVPLGFATHAPLQEHGLALPKKR